MDFCSITFCQLGGECSSGLTINSNCRRDSNSAFEISTRSEVFNSEGGLETWSGFWAAGDFQGIQEMGMAEVSGRSGAEFDG